MKHFHKATEIDVPATLLEKWHQAPGAFRRLAPPWERMRILEEPASIDDGTRALIAMKAGPFWTKWTAEHVDCVPGERFSDVQIKGPFADWKHTHWFHEVSEHGSRLEDDIRYRLPLGPLGSVFGGPLVRRKLERTFRYRHTMTKMDLERMASEPTGNGQSLTVLVTGATGMIGTALESFLRMRGHTVRRVTRRPSCPGDVRWDIKAGEMDLSPSDKIDAAVHLAGENVAGGRWTEERKTRIMESRRFGTRLLCKTLASLKQPPKVLVSASGANYYAQGTEVLQDETAPRGEGFLADVCQVWEDETLAAKEAGVRVMNLRLGVVLSPAGGALSKMLPAFQLGVAGRLGSGKQRLAWIALDDVIDIIHRGIRDERYQGAVNGVAPQSVSNQEFTRSLASVLRRPAIIPVPAAGLRLALGAEMANETLLADLAIAPGKLEALGYPFRFPELDRALRCMLGKG